VLFPSLPLIHQARKASKIMHIIVKDLPQSIQSALKAVGYHGRDVSVEPKEKVPSSMPSGH
jgi:hypothetical protein